MQLRLLRGAIDDRDVAWATFAGDMNFVDPAEARWCVRRRMAIHACEAGVALFEEASGESVEGAARALDTVSRIDRVWANAPTAFLVAQGATCWAGESIYAVRMGFR